MKILYLSCHSILEYQELKLFTELGYEVFSHGAYLNLASPGDEKRPAIEGGVYNDHMVSLAIHHSKDNLHPEMIEPYDVIMIMGGAESPIWLKNNWEKFKGKTVIWRSIGQSVPAMEQQIKRYRDQGLKIVRYSPRENNLVNFAGSDWIIRFYGDPDEFCLWDGKWKRVMTVVQDFKHRGDWVGYKVWESVTKDFNRVLYGPTNEGLDYWMGVPSYDDLRKALRQEGCFFYAGTRPAPYTLSFIEAWMSGIPVVALGENIIGKKPEWPQGTYEVPHLITNRESGCIASTEDEMRGYIRDVLEDRDFAEKLSNNGRQKAIETFGKEQIKNQWQEFFKKHCNV
jgi:hypothetical protein